MHRFSSKLLFGFLPFLDPPRTQGCQHTWFAEDYVIFSVVFFFLFLMGICHCWMGGLSRWAVGCLARPAEPGRGALGRGAGAEDSGPGTGGRRTRPGPKDRVLERWSPKQARHVKGSLKAALLFSFLTFGREGGLGGWGDDLECHVDCAQSGGALWVTWPTHGLDHWNYELFAGEKKGRCTLKIHFLVVFSSQTKRTWLLSVLLLTPLLWLPFLPQSPVLGVFFRIR